MKLWRTKMVGQTAEDAQICRGYQVTLKRIRTVYEMKSHEQ